MAWTNPMTFTSAVLTAAQLNTHLRDNLLETAPAKATNANRWFVTTGANAIAERVITQDNIIATQTTTSTSFVDLATPGPTVTATTGTQAIIIQTAQMANSNASAVAMMSWAISGATTQAASDDTNLYYQQASSAGNVDMRASTVYKTPSLTAGSNTFTAKYKVNAGTGSFGRRVMMVMAM